MMQVFRQTIFAITVATALTQGTHTTASARLITQAATVRVRWTSVRINPASMAPPAGAMWEDTRVM